MILFLSEQPDNTLAMKHFTALAVRAGEPAIVVQQPEQPEPSRWMLSHIGNGEGKALMYDIGGFEVFRYNAQADKFRCTRYGSTDDEIYENSLRWYAHFVLVLETYIQRMGVDQLVVWGSSILGTRAAIFAAEDLGLKVSCIEDGWFRAYQGAISTRTFTVTPGRAYYETVPQVWLDAFEEFHHISERLADYREWWRGARQTKYSGTGKQELLIDDGVQLPAEWLNGNRRVVWFGQLYGDAATFWRTGAGSGAIKAFASAKDAWYKPHPFTQETNAPTGLKSLPQSAQIHDLLPDTDEVLCLTSNVGLEARMYDVPVEVFGEPFYVDFPGDRGTDYIIHKLQFAADDATRFVELLHDDL